MRIEMVDMGGVLTRVLVVQCDDDATMCENCGAENFNHPMLAKADTDWCMNCNDEEARKSMTESEFARWALNQMMLGKAVAVVRGYE